jgi:hypothetical protein
MLRAPELIGRVHLACPQYYFCTYNGAQKAGANCIELPTYDEEIGLYLCTMGHGARPSYDDDWRVELYIFIYISEHPERTCSDYAGPKPIVSSAWASR